MEQECYACFNISVFLTEFKILTVTDLGHSGALAARSSLGIRIAPITVISFKTFYSS